MDLQTWRPIPNEEAWPQVHRCSRYHHLEATASGGHAFRHFVHDVRRLDRTQWFTVAGNDGVVKSSDDLLAFFGHSLLGLGQQVRGQFKATEKQRQGVGNIASYRKFADSRERLKCADPSNLKRLRLIRIEVLLSPARQISSLFCLFMV